ncbi:MAG TPA: HAD-IA family hydrolase [Terriglobia bacterium]|nr:HAD-IA family hydrolase [Terriglobia bacterium]
MKAVFFDIGETLIEETRAWTVAADWLGIPPMTMFGVLGSLIHQGRDHRELFDILRPDVGWKGFTEYFRDDSRLAYLPEDLYPDVRPTLANLKQRGYFVGIVGNQPAEREKDLRDMDLPADLIATSDGWGLKKPERAFFDRVVREAGCPREEVVYVGDRVDNDVLPAAAAGLIPIHIIRGAWGYIQRDWPGVAKARAQVRSLNELPDLLDRL